MLNLLFISDSPKVEYIKNALQPVLKVIIDVVTDFDHGLKDVFEKRPATVCIQDQIGGVTGESVARHIQMLLGNSAPTFILLHTGNGKARLIKGLYEYLVDLSQSDETVAEDITNTLKSLLGDQWHKIYIPPKLTPALVRSSVAVPEESRVDADRLVDDFLSDLETAGFSTVDDPTAVVADTSFDSMADISMEAPGRPNTLSDAAGSVHELRTKVQSTNDEMADLLPGRGETGTPVEPPVGARAVATESGVTVGSEPKPAPVVASPPPAAEIMEPTGKTVRAAPPEKPVVPTLTPKEAQPVVPVNRPLSPRPALAHQEPQTLAPPTPSEFRINHTAPSHEDEIPEDLLLAFEENYRPEPFYMRRAVIIPLVSIALIAGGWYFITQKPQLISSLTQQFTPTPVIKPLPKVEPPKIPLTVPVTVQPPPAPQPVAPTPSLALPVFIPANGHDPSYALKNPGWDRFVGTDAEFRVFKTAGRLQAVQVLAMNEVPVSPTMMATVLKEFAGSSEYQITSRSKKAGVRVEKGSIQNKYEIMVYRKKGAVKAFVVSAN
jgi:hypothetical protein